MQHKTIRAGALLLAVFLALAGASGHAQQPIQSGLWQFTSQGDAPTPSPGSRAEMNSGFINCIDPAQSVPIDPKLKCQVNAMDRRGAAVNWSTTCITPHGTFQSQGVAQYSGGTMTGTLSTYVPMIGSQVTQRISGRYLGPCTR